MRSKPSVSKLTAYAVLTCVALAVITTNPIWVAGAVLAVLVGFAVWALQ